MSSSCYTEAIPLCFIQNVSWIERLWAIGSFCCWQPSCFQWSTLERQDLPRTYLAHWAGKRYYHYYCYYYYYYPWLWTVLGLFWIRGPNSTQTLNPTSSSARSPLSVVSGGKRQTWDTQIYKDVSIQNTWTCVKLTCKYRNVWVNVYTCIYTIQCVQMYVNKYIYIYT